MRLPPHKGYSHSQQEGDCNENRDYAKPIRLI
jgi:hypothetical protein